MPLWTMVWNFPCTTLFLWWEAALPRQVCCMNTHALAILVKNQLWSSVGWGLHCGPLCLWMRMTEALTSTRVDCRAYTNSACCCCCSVAKYLNCSVPGFLILPSLLEFAQIFMSVKWVMPSNCLILCHPLLFGGLGLQTSLFFLLKALKAKLCISFFCKHHFPECFLVLLRISYGINLSVSLDPSNWTKKFRAKVFLFFVFSFFSSLKALKSGK